MLATGRDEARRRGVPFIIMTFDPHPALILKPSSERSPLTTIEQRLELLDQFSPAAILLIHTTPEFLAMSADAFLQNVVRGIPSSPPAPESPEAPAGIGAALLVEGPTFTYGKGAKGTVDTLQRAGPAMGLEVRILPTRQQTLTDLTLVNISSSLIRWLVGHGRVADAARCLGRPYTLRGTVVEGERRGRTLGFPTANLRSQQLTPAAGIYAGTATITRNARQETYRAAISVGTNPTFQGRHTTVEAFLLDFDGDLYGQTLDLALLRWVREMTAFGGVESLIRQMTHDVACTRRTIPLTSRQTAPFPPNSTPTPLPQESA
jgi:riboflavin kinase/FMN adenylyltransferase